MASAGSSQAIDATGETIFDAATDGGKCKAFVVGVRQTSSKAALVNVPGLHKAGEFMGIPAGASIEFVLGTAGIASVFVKGDAGVTTIDYGRSNIQS